MIKKLFSILLSVAMLVTVTVSASAAAPKAAASLSEENSYYDSYHSRSALSDIAYAFAGVDSDGDYYFLVFDEDIEYVGLVFLTEDGTQSFNAVGDVSISGQYMTINDTYSGYSITFKMDFLANDDIRLTFRNGSKVTMTEVDPEDVIDLIIAIDEHTEIINPLA